MTSTNQERADPPDGDPRASEPEPGTAEQWQPPWLAEMQSGSWSPERASLIMAFAVAVRRTGSLMHLMSQAAADKIGINPTDLNCLNILHFNGQMTAGELAKATGLTTASITGVVDRLEEAGFVHRERDAADRRRVVIKLDAEKSLRTIAPVFGPMMGAWSRLANQYTDDELRLILGFYDQIAQIIREHLDRLRESPSPGGDVD